MKKSPTTLVYVNWVSSFSSESTKHKLLSPQDVKNDVDLPLLPLSPLYIIMFSITKIIRWVISSK